MTHHDTPDLRPVSKKVTGPIIQELTEKGGAIVLLSRHNRELHRTYADGLYLSPEIADNPAKLLDVLEGRSAPTSHHPFNHIDAAMREIANWPEEKRVNIRIKTSISEEMLALMFIRES